MRLEQLSEQYRMISNGLCVRIEFSYYVLNGGRREKWTPIGETYQGCGTFGYTTIEPFEFPNTDLALQFLRKHYGSSGVNKLLDSWVPVTPFARVT